jgi:hypothetical protein
LFSKQAVAPANNWMQNIIRVTFMITIKLVFQVLA